MTCRNIYELSLALLGEDPGGSYSDDYLVRAPFILAAICSSLAERDSRFRKELDLEEHGEIPIGSIALTEDFPLCREFSTAAAYYLAAMLAFDGDTARSDSLYEKYIAAADDVMASIPAVSTGIIDKYPD